MANLSDLFPAPASGATYSPAMMKYDGLSTFYTLSSIARSGNKQSFVARFTRSTFTGNKLEFIVRTLNSAKTADIGQLYVASTDYAGDSNLAGKLVFRVQNSAGSTVCLLVSTNNFLDGSPHTVLASYDGDTGAAQLIVDGVDEDDTGNGSRVTPTTATLATSLTHYIVGSATTGGLYYFSGEIGFCGYDDQYLTAWADFMDSSGGPVKQDEATWSNSGWGSQPLFWNEHGEMSNNQGSAGNMTENGAPVIAPAIDPA